MIRRLVSALALVAVLLLLAGCPASSPSGSPRKRDLVLQNYAAAVRWNDFDAAWEFIDPATRLARPLTDLERERFKQVRVTGYEVRNMTVAPDGLTLDQVVEIHLVSVHNQVERLLTDHQHWTYDPLAKKWWLSSGLPDFERR